MRGGQSAGEDVGPQMKVALGSHAATEKGIRSQDLRDKAGTAYARFQNR